MSIPVYGPVRVIQVGAGVMGRLWLKAIADSADAELVGVVDLDHRAALNATDEAGFSGVPVGASLAEFAGDLADAVINVTVPMAHRPLSIDAMFQGFPVLCEKPLAPTVAEALSMVAASEITGRLLMASQSRRYVNAFIQLRNIADQLGAIGTVTCDLFMAPRFGGFRDEMMYPLLVDMAIHHFDAARCLTAGEPLSVYCDAYNPSWSWYAGDAAAAAVFEFNDQSRFIYNGSWCSAGHVTSWNGQWRISAERGSAVWNGSDSPIVDTGDREIDVRDVEGPQEISGALAEFVRVLRTDETPSSEAHRNVLSLAMVEAAVRSAETGRRVVIGDILVDAHAQAIRAELREDVRAVLEKWKDVREIVGLVVK